MPMVGYSIKPDDLYKMHPRWELLTKFEKEQKIEVTRPQLPLSDPQLANAGTGKAATCAWGPAGASCSGASNAFILSKPFPGYHQKHPKTIFSHFSSKKNIPWIPICYYSFNVALLTLWSSSMLSWTANGFHCLQKCFRIKRDDLYKIPSGWELLTKNQKGKKESSAA